MNKYLLNKIDFYYNSIEWPSPVFNIQNSYGPFMDLFSENKIKYNTGRSVNSIVDSLGLIYLADLDIYRRCYLDEKDNKLKFDKNLILDRIKTTQLTNASYQNIINIIEFLYENKVLKSQVDELKTYIHDLINTRKKSSSRIRRSTLNSDLISYSNDKIEFTNQLSAIMMLSDLAIKTIENPNRSEKDTMVLLESTGFVLSKFFSNN